MRPYFNKMTPFGRENPERNRADVQNIQNHSSSAASGLQISDHREENLS
jgi:hypothetical protein